MSSRQLVAGVTRAARPAYAHARPLRLLTPSAARPTVPSSSRLRSLHTSLRRLQKEPDAPQADLPTQTTAAVERKLHDAEAAASFNDPMTRYEFLVKEGILRADPHQKNMVKKLQRLWNDLKDYDPGEIPELSTEVEPSLFGKFFTRKTSAHEPTIPLDQIPKGLYLYGSVGTGKTMLMDLFYSTLPSQFQPTGKYKATRIHFHAFMIEVQKRQHEVTAQYERDGQGKRVALPEVARSIAKEGRVLCFDEFQVTDIVTAMLLRGLFERLLDYGVVCFITSNRHPDELYINGIQRESFIPAIELIKERFEVVDLNSGTDYRKLPRTITHVYYSPLNEETHNEMDKLFHALTQADSDPEIKVGRKLSLWGRELRVPESSGHVARFTFDDLCNKPLSAADYLTITGKFSTVFVEDMPKLTLNERDQARRFITFIDACYENKTKLFISSAKPIYTIFSDEGGSTVDAEQMKHVMEELGINPDIMTSSSLFSSDEELFAFARCVSRLTQMSTKEWADESARAHPM